MDDKKEVCRGVTSPGILLLLAKLTYKVTISKSQLSTLKSIRVSLGQRYRLKR